MGIKQLLARLREGRGWGRCHRYSRRESRRQGGEQRPRRLLPLLRLPALLFHTQAISDVIMSPCRMNAARDCLQYGTTTRESRENQTWTSHDHDIRPGGATLLQRLNLHSYSVTEATDCVNTSKIGICRDSNPPTKYESFKSSPNCWNTHNIVTHSY